MLLLHKISNRKYSFHFAQCYPAHSIPGELSLYILRNGIANNDSDG